MTFELFAWMLTPLIPALIALYFLKLKRREVVVSSTFLWKRSLEDLHVNAPFQRLRRSLLLLLQLLILLLVILAASRPMISALGLIGVARIILIDNSASMNVREEEGTRLEIARRKALDLVDAMAGGDRAAVISFAGRAVLVQPFTADAAKLRQAIGSIRPTSLPTDFRAALETAGSLAQAELEGGVEIQIFSDGAFGNLVSVDPELQRLTIRFNLAGTAAENIGITELDARRTLARDQRVEIFAAVSNRGSRDERTTLALYRGDVLADAAELELPAGKTVPHVFDGSRYAGEVLRLQIDRGGALPDDDRAWVRIDPPRPIELLLVGERNYFIEKVIETNPLLKARRVSLGSFEEMAADGRLASDAAQVLIFNRRAPARPPDRPAIYLGCYPDIPELAEAIPAAAPATPGDDGAPPAAAPIIKGPVIVDWDRGHPVNRFLAFADLLLAESRRFQESSRFRSIIDSGEGSIAGVATLTPSGRPAMSVVVLGFAIEDTNWPFLPSFPIFFNNAFQWLGAASGSDAVPRYRTGEALVHYLGAEPAAGELAFRDPEGAEHPAAAASGTATFAGAVMPGIYELRRGEETIARFPVSLLDERESSIAPGKEIRIGSSEVAAEQEVPRTRDLWKWFALAALAIVLLEWWVYNRRMTL